MHGDADDLAGVTAQLDHGRTSCKTPDAGTYITTTLERQAARRR